MATGLKLSNSISAAPIMAQAFRAIRQNKQALQELNVLSQQRPLWIANGGRNTLACLADSSAFHVVENVVEKHTPAGSQGDQKKSKLFFDDIVFSTMEFLASQIEHLRQQQQQSSEILEQLLDLEADKIEDVQKRTEDEQLLQHQQEEEKTSAELHENTDDTPAPAKITLPIVLPTSTSQALQIFETRNKFSSTHRSTTEVKDVEADYYKQLGISREATDKEIRTAYRRQALIHHPDKAANKENAAKEFPKISRAYEVLNDPHSRAAYDNRNPQAGKIQLAQVRKAATAA
jgi:DnaJ-domain-containing protein 1